MVTAPSVDRPHISDRTGGPRRMDPGGMPMRSSSDVLVFILAALIATGTPNLARAQATDVLDRYRAQREAFIDTYRLSGQQDRKQLDAITSGLAALAQQSTGELHAQALLELGIAQRMSGDHRTAMATYSEGGRGGRGARSARRRIQGLDRHRALPSIRDAQPRGCGDRIRARGRRDWREPHPPAGCRPGRLSCSARDCPW